MTIGMVILIIAVVVLVVLLIVFIYNHFMTTPPALADLTPFSARFCPNADCEITVSYRLQDVDELELRIGKEAPDPGTGRLLWRRPNSGGLPLSDFTTVSGNNVTHRLRADTDGLFEGAGQYRLNFALRRTSPASMDATVTVFATVMDPAEPDIEILGELKTIGRIDADMSDQSDPGVGIAEVAVERLLYGPSATDPEGEAVCAGSRVSGVKLVECAAAFASKDPNFQTQFPTVDVDRFHAPEVHLEIRRGDELVLDLGTLAAGGDQTIDPPVEIDGGAPLVLHCAMRAGSEGNYQHGFQVGFRSEWRIACPV